MKVLLFTRKSKTSPLIKALSKEFLKTLVFGVVRASELELINMYGITKLPSIFVITDSDTSSGVTYQGTIQKDQIKKFLNKYSAQHVDLVRNKAKKAKFLDENLYFKKNCNEKDSNICFIYVYDRSTMSSPTTTEQIGWVQSLAGQYKKDKLSFYFTDTDNLDYQETFE